MDGSKVGRCGRVGARLKEETAASWIPQRVVETQSCVGHRLHLQDLITALACEQMNYRRGHDRQSRLLGGVCEA